MFQMAHSSGTCQGTLCAMVGLTHTAPKGGASPVTWAQKPQASRLLVGLLGRGTALEAGVGVR